MCGPIIGFSRSDAPLEVATVHGPILERLDCDEKDILGTGWTRLIHPDDLPVTATIGDDLTAGRSGLYHLRNIGNNGHVLHVAVRTYLVRRGFGVTPTIYTTAMLLAWHTPRTLFDLTPKLLPMRGVVSSVVLAALAWL